MAVTAGILPTHHRFHGAPIPFRRSFRPRERYLIFFVFLAFACVCFGTMFFLPEFRSRSLQKVYSQVGNVGENLLLPPPLLEKDNKTGAYKHPGVIRDPHIEEDRNRFSKVIDGFSQPRVIDKPILKPSTPKSSQPRVIEEEVVVQEPVHNNPSHHLPVVQGGEDPDPVAQTRREKVKEMMLHAWKNYEKYAWGKNELKPITKVGHSAGIFGKTEMGATIVDAMDTLYIMGLNDEYQKARDWVTSRFNLNGVNADVSVFEANIRFVGGLLSCYALTGDEVLKDKAEQVVKKLLPAFNTPTGIPYALVNLHTGAAKNYYWASGFSSILSEFGTLHLEFSYLSDITGDSIYKQKVDRIRDAIRGVSRPKGTYSNYLNPKTAKWGQQHVSLGALGDSFYEYLLKAWLQSGKTDAVARNMYEDAMKTIVSKMVKTSKNGLTYVAELKFDRPEHKMDHLACFSGGMFALGAYSHAVEEEDRDRHMQIGEGITNTCHESYDRTPTKLGPESFRFTDTLEAKSLKVAEKYYILRPETFESYFILWRLTKDQKYRDWGWEAVQALERWCRVDGGYTGLKNVYMDEPQKDDVQQSYFLAETLKYLYLLFSNDDLLSLDEWVFNTEAHPLPVKGSNAFYREHE